MSFALAPAFFLAFTTFAVSVYAAAGDTASGAQSIPAGRRGAAVSGAQATSGEGPALVQIRVLSGEDAVFTAGATTARVAEVQITDEAGRPVEGAAVSFLLPEDGPTGIFAGGLRTDIVITDREGRAGAHGIRWSAETGLVQLRVTAVKGPARAGTVISIHLAQLAGERSVEVTPNQGSSGGGVSKKWLLVGLAAAAGIGAGVALGMSGSGSSAPAAVSATPAGPVIGNPSIVVSKP